MDRRVRSGVDGAGPTALYSASMSTRTLGLLILSMACSGAPLPQRAGTPNSEPPGGAAAPDDSSARTEAPDVPRKSPSPEAPVPASPFIVVLGTAQDGGFPHASCDCPRCAGARSQAMPRRLVASLGLVLPRERKRYLIDVSPDVREQLVLLTERTWRSEHEPPGVDRAPLDGVFLTHAHIGHYVGLAFFGFEAVHTRGLAVHATPEMAAFLGKNGPWDQLVRLGNVELRPTPPGTTVDLGAVQVTARLVPHRREYTDTVAYVIQGPTRRVVYMPDSDPWDRWPEAASELTRGADVLLLDGSFHSAAELPGRSVAEIGHPLIPNTMDRFQDGVRAGSVRVYFTHLNHSNPAVDPTSSAQAEIRARGYRVLSDGEILEL